MMPEDLESSGANCAPHTLQGRSADVFVWPVVATGCTEVSAFKAEEFVGVCGFSSLDWVTAWTTDTYLGEPPYLLTPAVCNVTCGCQLCPLSICTPGCQEMRVLLLAVLHCALCGCVQTKASLPLAKHDATISSAGGRSCCCHGLESQNHAFLSCFMNPKP